MRLDLNLLTVIEAVMQEGSVTRAASTLGMSQPAVSNALRRARRLIRDDLFLKVAGGVQPSAQMRAIWPDMHRSLAAIRTLLAPDGFDPATHPMSFRVAVTDSLAGELVPAIVVALAAASPGARVNFNIHTNSGSSEAVERGTLDCAVGMFPSVPRGFHVQALRPDRYVCVMRGGHPWVGSMTLERFVECSHVLVTPSGVSLGAVDGWLTLQGRVRNIGSVVNRFAEALPVVAATDLLTCAPRGYLDGPGRMLVERHGLVAVELPFETERLLYKLIWHERLHAHAAHRWFRALMVQVCGGLEAADGGEDRQG